VVSPYSRPHAVTNVVHDHTSILATIEAKWNLPACTYRDANATTMMDFLDTSRAAFADPPTLAAAGDIAKSEANCSDADPVLTVRPNPPPAAGRPGAKRHLSRSRRHHHHRRRSRKRHHRAKV
jgi:phospholipase C